MPNLVDSYDESNQNNFTQLGSGSYTAFGQSFTGNAEKLESCKFFLRKTGSPTGNVVAKLYAHSGTFGTSSVPTGAALATSDNFNIATLTTSFQLITFTFTGAQQYLMSAGTKYFIAIEYTGGGGSDLLEPGYDTSSPTHAGNMARDFGGWGSASGADACFYVYSIPATTTYTITANVGAFALTGIAATFFKTLNLIASAGAFVLTGSAVGLGRRFTLIADTGSYAMTGIAVAFRKTLHIAAAAGTFALTGVAVTFRKVLQMVASTGIFNLVGQGIQFRLNGWLAQYQDKYSSRGSSFSNKYSSRGSSYSDKYERQ